MLTILRGDRGKEVALTKTKILLTLPKQNKFLSVVSGNPLRTTDHTSIKCSLIFSILVLFTLAISSVALWMSESKESSSISEHDSYLIKCGTLDESSKLPLIYPSKYLILCHKIKFHYFISFIILYSTSTWRLMGSAWFPSSIIFIQLTNELSWFTGQRSNGSI